MKQEVKDFLSKVGIKLVEPYVVIDTNSYELLVIAEHPAIINNTLCIDSEGRTLWITKESLTPIKPKSRSIEDGLVEGDIITDGQYDKRVLMANQYCVILSCNNHKEAGNAYTYSELIEMGYTLEQ